MAKRKLFDYSRVSRRERSYILAAMLFWSVLAYLGVSRLVFHSVEVTGNSMAPTISDGDRLVAHRWMLHVRSLERSDIIAVKIPWHNAASVKRIVALPGETICLKEGRVWVDGDRLDERYLPEQVITQGGWIEGRTFEVLTDCYFVLGDNRADSVDSRDFGAIRRDWILGTVL